MLAVLGRLVIVVLWPGIVIVAAGVSETTTVRPVRLKVLVDRPGLPISTVTVLVGLEGLSISRVTVLVWTPPM